jgi:threonine/homoserine/homoserine lactone efflux protein
MRMAWSALAACVIAMALGAIVPGPTTALVVRRSAVDGFRAAAGGTCCSGSLPAGKKTHRQAEIPPHP